MKTFPNSQKEIIVKDRKYTINYPNTGQLIDIERFKATITGDRYDAIVRQDTNSSAYAKFLVDMTAIFNVLCPDLIKDMKVKSILELEAKDSNLLLRLYIKEILPWFIEWDNILSADEDIEEENGK